MKTIEAIGTPRACENGRFKRNVLVASDTKGALPTVVSEYADDVAEFPKREVGEVVAVAMRPWSATDGRSGIAVSIVEM